MRTVGEYVGMTLFILLCLWMGFVSLAPRPEKPLAACRPVTTIAKGVRDALVALAPGGGWERTADQVNVKLSRGCLTYMANYWAVTQKD